MEISPVQQAMLMLFCAALGAAAGIVFDAFYEICLPLPPKVRGAVRFLSDLCCVGIIFLGIITLSFYFDKGRIRFFDFLGAIIGFAFYRALFSRLVKMLFRVIIRLVSRFLRIFMIPCVFICKKIKKTIKICKVYIHKSLEKNKYMLYNIYNNIIMLKWAKTGFMPKRRNK